MRGQATLPRPSARLGCRDRGRPVPSWARQSSSVFRAGAVRWMQAVTTAGTLEAKPQGGDTLSHRIEAFQQRHPGRRGAQKDISLVELADLLRTEHGASFGASTVWRCLDRHGMTFKKRRTPPSRSGPTSQPGAGPGSSPSLISIRGVWSTSTRSAPRLEKARLPGRAPKGERCRAAVPHGHWENDDLHRGASGGRHDRPMVLEGPMIRVALQAYIEQVLVPTLNRGDTVIMENLPADIGAEVRRAVEAVGASLRYLPPYLPEFNPVENAFPSSRHSCAKLPRGLSTTYGT